MAQYGPQLISLLIILPLLIFWFVMFRHMLQNDTLPNVAKDYWTVAFVLLSIAAAVYYYATVYERRS